jgi:hypothetical protein
MSNTPRCQPGLEAETGEVTAERRLWLAVLSQAIADATANVTRTFTMAKRNSAREWLTTPSPDLAYVCEHAGADMHRFITYAKQHIAVSADNHRAPRLRQRSPRLGMGRPEGSGRKARCYRHNGESLPLSEWAKRLGVSTVALHKRISQGWPIERVLGTPRGRRQLTDSPRDRRGTASARDDRNRVFDTCQ